jgi:hypothetical protein
LNLWNLEIIRYIRVIDGKTSIVAIGNWNHPCIFYILKVIKESGVTLVARIAGLLLAAIAVQMLVDAIRVFVAN